MPIDSIRFRVFESPDSACACAASEIARLIRERAALNRPAVIGFATGATPLALFEELIYLHQEEGLSFANVVTFNLDEYLGRKPDDPLSFRSFMMRELFNHLNVPARNQHFLRGDIPKSTVASHCADYEREIVAAGGIDIQLLGIGRNGHIGFNEPGSSIDGRTRRVALAASTREDAASGFGGLDKVPNAALTMGCATILDARRIILMAWGAKKASIVRRALAEPVTPKIPASFLSTHPAVEFFLDPPAAALLRKNR
ncbi:MAG: 6-phosphogluconolactonase [Verrucomicrobiota bacterium]